MYFQRSHGRLVTILAIIWIPVGLSFGAGIWLSQQSQEKDQRKLSQERLRGLAVQAQLLRNQVAEEIENIRDRAITLAQTNASGSKEGVLYWAKFEVQNQAVGAVKQAVKNSDWNDPAFSEDSFLQSIKWGLNPEEIEKNGIEVIQMKRDPSSASEWLNLAFPWVFQGQKYILLTLVDPVRIFSGIRDWMAQSVHGKSRSYLVGGDGYVVVHSQRSRIASDFSGLPLFQNFVKKVIQGTWVSGYGDYMGIDELPIGAAYYRVGKLPLATVVEEIRSDQLEWMDWGKVIAETLLAVISLGIIVLGCGLFLKTYLILPVPYTIRTQPTAEGVPPQGEEKDQGTPESTPAHPPLGKFFKGDEMLILDTKVQNDRE